MRDLHATDRFPVRQHEIKVRIAVDVIVVSRADGSGQMSFGIEENGECRWAVSIRDRRQRLLAESLGSRGADLSRFVHSLHEEPGRPTLELTLMRGHADARHCLAALFIRDITEGRQHGLCVFRFHWRLGIFLIAVPRSPCPAVGDIPSYGKGSISEKA